ncbi:MAG: glycosyltransferase [Syntrophomonadaceae bacterium]|nr:glycosyltransferase [Syntrophomonadaceae bacterium]
MTEQVRLQRVIFILPNISGGGAERVTLNVMRNLDRRQFQPVLFLIKNQGVYWGEIPSDVQVIAAMEGRERVRWHLLKLIRCMQREVNKDDIVIGAMEYDAIFLAALAGIIKGCRTIGWFRCNIGFWTDRLSLVHKILISWLFPALSAVLTVSQGVADSVIKAYPRLKPRLQVLYNPLDVDQIRQQAQLSPAVLRKEHDCPIIIGAGRLEYAKHFDILIRAHAKLLAWGIRQELIILGEGNERTCLQCLIDDLDVNETVSLPGFQANPFAIIQQAAVFVLSSRFEGLPGVLLQALALGVPVVAADCPSGPDEILEHGRYGLLVPPDDMESMTEAIARVLTDPELAERLARLGRERAEHFRPENTIPAFEKLLSALSQQ